MRSRSGRHPEEAVGFGLVLAAVREFGHPDVPLPEGPPFFRFSDQAEFRRTLEHAGFTDVQVRTLPLTWRLPAADAVFDAISRGGVRTSAVLRAQTPAALESIRAAVRRGVERYESGRCVPRPDARGARVGEKWHQMTPAARSDAAPIRGQPRRLEHGVGIGAEHRSVDVR